MTKGETRADKKLGWLSAVLRRAWRLLASLQVGGRSGRQCRGDRSLDAQAGPFGSATGSWTCRPRAGFQ